MEAELNTPDPNLRIPLVVRDASSAVPRCLSAIGQDAGGTHLIALRLLARPHEDQGVVGLILRDEQQRWQEQCEALYGSVFDSGELDAIGNPSSAAELMRDYFQLQFDAERDRPRPSQAAGMWQGYFEPYKHGRRLTLFRQVDQDRLAYVGEYGNGWGCWTREAPTSDLVPAPERRYPYLREALEAAMMAANVARRPGAERLLARGSLARASRRSADPTPIGSILPEVLEHVLSRHRH